MFIRFGIYITTIDQQQSIIIKQYWISVAQKRNFCAPRGCFYRRDKLSRNLYTRNLHRIECSSIPCKFLVPQVSDTRNFQTQPTYQTAQFWSRASVQVSGTSFWCKFLDRVSQLLTLFICIESSAWPNHGEVRAWRHHIREWRHSSRQSDAARDQHGAKSVRRLRHRGLSVTYFFVATVLLKPKDFYRNRFGFELPSVILDKRCSRFNMYNASENLSRSCKTCGNFA